MRKLFLVLILTSLLTAPLWGWFSYSLDDPIDELLENGAIDFVYDGVYVWIATNAGISGTSDGGQTWRSYNSSNGLLDNSISALALVGDELWVAVTDSTQPNTVSRGIVFTADRGDNWFSLDDYRLRGFGRVIFDISNYDSLILLSGTASGLVRSTDNGNTWDNIFPDAEVESLYAADSLLAGNTAADYRGRSISNLIDPYYDDTLIVWSGSVEGIYRYYYIGRSKKIASDRILDVADGGDGRWWLATDMGISILTDSNLTFNSYFVEDGLPGNVFSAIGASGEICVAGLFDTLSQEADGFAVTTDAGVSWSHYLPTQATGPGSKVEEVEFWGNDIWAACDGGGLMRSNNTGMSWETIYPPAGETPPEVLTNIHSIDIAMREDFTRISAGTDSGLVVLYYSDPTTLDSTVHLPLFDNLAWGQRVVSVATAITEFADEFWLAVHPHKSDVGSGAAVLRSTNRGLFWEHFLTGPPAVTPFDLEIGPAFADSGTAIWVATEDGLRRSRNFGINFDVFNSYGPAVARNSVLNCIEVDSGRVFAGSDQFGAAFTPNYGLAFASFRAQNDPTKFDFVGRSYPGQALPDTVEGLGAGFIVAMELQRIGDSSIVWVSAQPSPSGNQLGLYRTSNRGFSWDYSLPDVEAYNLSFNGDTVFAATFSGLWMSPDVGATWGKLSIVDQVSGRFISESTDVNGVSVIGDEVWVGTSDGIAHSLLTDLDDWAILRSFFQLADNADGDDLTFASPSPFSPYLQQQLKFHYRLKNAGMVTITIYDFANNLVKTVVRDAQREADVQYDDIDVWDGINGAGDIVAAGVYFYHIESSGGDEMWGNFMVIP